MSTKKETEKEFNRITMVYPGGSKESFKALKGETLKKAMSESKRLEEAKFHYAREHEDGTRTLIDPQHLEEVVEEDIVVRALPKKAAGPMEFVAILASDLRAR